MRRKAALKADCLTENYGLQKIADANLISRLKRPVGGEDAEPQKRLPNLAPRQAIVAADSTARLLLVAIDPMPSKRRTVE